MRISSVCSTCLELTDPGEVLVRPSGNYCSSACAGELLLPVEPNGPRRARVFFNSALVALGTGPVAAAASTCSEVMTVAEDPTGKTYTQLRLERAHMLRDYRRVAARRSELEAVA